MSTHTQRAEAQPIVLPQTARGYPQEEQSAEGETTSQTSGSTNGLSSLAIPTTGVNPTPQAHMRIKRSLSPDGRINAISVYIDYPIGTLSISEIKAKAQKTLLLQSDIAWDYFTDGEPAQALPLPATQQNGNGKGKGTPAKLLDISSLPGKWGPRYFIKVDVGGKQAKLFGSPKQLVTHLAHIGMDLTPDAVSEGLRLNRSCLAVTELSSDGRYLNVVGIYPAT